MCLTYSTGGGVAEAPKAPLESATDYDILKVATIFLNFHVFPTFGTDDSGFFFRVIIIIINK